jgi:electron transfer flavoprotein alpha subunit
LFVAATPPTVATAAEDKPHPLQPREAGRLVREEIGLGAAQRDGALPFAGPIEDALPPELAGVGVVAVLASDSEGAVRPTARAVVRAALGAARWQGVTAAVLCLVPEEERQRHLAAQVRAWFAGDLLLVPLAENSSDEVAAHWLRACWPKLALTPHVLVGEPWTEAALPALARTQDPQARVALGVERLEIDAGRLILETSRARGKLRLRQQQSADDERSCWISLAPEAEIEVPQPSAAPQGRVWRWRPQLDRFYARGDIRRLLDELEQETGLTRLADAEVIIDVGFGVGNRDGYEAVIEPLERALRGLGVRSLTIGGSRKVTEELHLLPADRQIGQSGVNVNPRLLLAIGVSGAPQHLNYIGPRATIVAFNRDPEAPIMTWNQRQARPRVFPVIGDLFETVPALIAALGAEQNGTPGTGQG